jgi:hypothetical protein
MKRYQFFLRILPEDYLDYYRGVARHVVVHATSGETVQFPAGLLVKFVTEAGVDGHFVLLCDSNNKCVSLERIAVLTRPSAG